MSVLTITEETYEAEVLNSDRAVLLDFWAAWCGPCRMASPIIEEISNEHTDIKVGKINVDEQPGLAVKFNITAIPTFAIIKGGKVINITAGVRPKGDMLKLLGK